MKTGRIPAILTAWMLCLGLLCACGAAANGSGAPEDNGPMTLFLSQQDEYLTHLQEECALAAEQAGYQFERTDAKGDADRQIRQIKKAAKKGEGAFLVNLVDPTRADEVIEAAGNRSIVFLNREPSDLSVLNQTHIYVGSEEEKAGELQGQVLAEYCHSKGMKELRYLLLLGPDSLPSSRQRADALLDVMQNTGFTMQPLCDPLVCDYDRETARKAVQQQFADGLDAGEIDCVLSANDAMALGAMEAISKERNQFQAEIEPIVVGVDGISDALQAIQDGTMMMTAYQDAERQAQTAVQAADNLNHGYPYDQGITAADHTEENILWISFQSITQDNVSSFLDEE